MKILFENEDTNRKVLTDFRNFIMKVFDDRSATTNKYYSSFRRFCRKIEKLADNLGELDDWGLDYSQDELEASKSVAGERLAYNVKKAMLNIDLDEYPINKNEILAYTMVWMLRRQLHSTRTDSDHTIFKFLNNLEDDVVDEVVDGLKNETEGEEEENRITESDDSYFGDSELDDADNPNGILHQRSDRSRYGYQKRSIDNWSAKRGWKYKKDFYLSSKSLMKEFCDTVDVPALLEDADVPVELDAGKTKNLSDLLQIGFNMYFEPFAYYIPQVGLVSEAIKKCPKNTVHKIYAAISRNYTPGSKMIRDFIRSADSAADVYVLDNDGLPVRFTTKYFKLLKQCISDSARGFAKDLKKILKDET